MEKEFEREVLDRLIKIETKLDEQDYKELKKAIRRCRQSLYQ